MTPTTAHVIVVDDKSSMWGNEIKVYGPYPTRDAAGMDVNRVSVLHPHRAFIVISTMEPGEIEPAPKPSPKPRPKSKVSK